MYFPINVTFCYVDKDVLGYLIFCWFLHCPSPDRVIYEGLYWTSITHVEWLLWNIFYNKCLGTVGYMECGDRVEVLKSKKIKGIENNNTYFKNKAKIHVNWRVLSSLEHFVLNVCRISMKCLDDCCKYTILVELWYIYYCGILNCGVFIGCAKAATWYRHWTCVLFKIHNLPCMAALKYTKT